MVETLIRKFYETCKRHPSRVAVEFSRKNSWMNLSWLDYQNIVENTASAFLQSGIQMGDRIAIWSNTRVEWAICDLAALSIGAVVVPIYQNSSADDISIILQATRPKLLVCENHQLVEKSGFKDWLPETTLVYFDIAIGTTASKTDLAFEHYVKQGEIAKSSNSDWIQSHLDRVNPETPATIVFTSGTTGKPRGAVLTQAQLLSEVSEAFPLLGVSASDKSLTFLPFAHVLGRVEVWGHALLGYTMAYAEGVDHIKEGLLHAQPTIMMAVPRIFEKLYNSILAQAEVSPLQKKVFKWALSVGREISGLKENHLPTPIDLSLKYRIAEKLVFAKIQKGMGGKLRFCVCGGAPLNRSIAEFFHAAGILILEGYGLTETTAAVCVNTPFDYRFGTVGKPIGDVRIKIADDGEILIKSKKVMTEYFLEPEATQIALKDGWYHTGDIGELSGEGYLRITDRKKELIKTAGGKYVAPQKLEGLLKASSLFSQVHIVGDQRKYVVALVTIDPVALRGISKYKADSGNESVDLNPQLREMVRKAIAEANSHLASFESIKNFAILKKDFSVEGGELTPSLKIKRKVVDEMYRDVIDQLYGSNDPFKREGVHV